MFCSAVAAPEKPSTLSVDLMLLTDDTANTSLARMREPDEDEDSARYTIAKPVGSCSTRRSRRQPAQRFLQIAAQFRQRNGTDQASPVQRTDRAIQLERFLRSRHQRSAARVTARPCRRC